MLKPIACSFLALAMLDGCAVGDATPLEEAPVPMRDGPRQHAEVTAPGEAIHLPAGPRPSTDSTDDEPSNAPVATMTGRTHSISVGSGTFSPRVIDIQLGDTVEFIWTSGTNSVTSGFHCKADGMFTSATRVTPATYRVTFLRTGVFPFYSEPECSTMTGLIAVTTPASS